MPVFAQDNAARFLDVVRNTAFTKPDALFFPIFFVKLTASSTTADAGTRVVIHYGSGIRSSGARRSVLFNKSSAALLYALAAV
jgi:hypothetical protein